MECIYVFIGLENIKYELECHRQERSFFIVMCVCNLHSMMISSDCHSEDVQKG